MGGGQSQADLRQRGRSEQAEAAGDPGRRPHQLPSGRHGLLRSFVAANQRDRILDAVAQAAAELGYAEMSVEAIIARAGVSRRTFYDHFKNKEDAFLAAYDAVVRQQARHIRRAYFEETTVRQRLRAGIRAYMEFIASEPDLARMCIVEVLAAGPRAMAKRNEAMRMFAEIIEDNIHELLPGCRRAALAAETIVGGIHEVVFSRTLANRIDELPGLADDLLVTILMLDVGADKVNAAAHYLDDEAGDHPRAAPVAETNPIV
jgi:AcrR family transcriptional regulator